MADVNAEGYIDPVINTDQSAPVWAPKHLVQGTEDAQEASARAQGDGDTIKRSFLYGDNYGVQIVKDIMRKGENGGIDPTFDRAGFIERNKARIEAPQTWRYGLAGNEAEANALLLDSEEQARQQKMLEQRGGFGTFVARGVAGLVDIDAPLALMSGGLSAEAKLGINATRYGRMTTGALTGAVTQVGAAEVGFIANPTEDWTSVPLAGIAGAVFGTIGGAMSRKHPELHTNERVSEAANAGRDKVLNEFGESVADGSVMSKIDIEKEPQTDQDLWGHQRHRATQEAAQETADALPEESVHLAPVEVTAPAGGASDKPKGLRVFKLSEAASQGEYPEGFIIADGSVGAARQASAGPGINSVQSQRLKDIITDAQARDQASGVSDQWHDNDGAFANPRGNKGVISDDAQEKLARGVKRFNDIVQASPLATDFNRMMRTGSSVFAMLAHDVFENSSGQIRNNRSAALLMEHYSKVLQSHVVPMNDAFDAWAIRSKQAGWYDRMSDSLGKGDMRKEFNEAVMTEMQARKYDNPNSKRAVEPEIRSAADALDRWSADDIAIGKGRPGEGTRLGYENLDAASGYMPQKWDGNKISKLISSDPNGYKKIVAAISEAYQVMHKGVAKSDTDIWAKAVVDRAQQSAEGLFTNLRGVLQADGLTAIEDLFRRNGMNEAEIARTIETITGTVQERSKPGYTKQRIDIDMRHTAQNGIKIMDLMDTDLNRIVATRSRQSAGASALARKGIRSKSEWDAIVEAGLEEQKANGKSVKTPGANLKDQALDYIGSDKHIDKDTMDHMYSYFGAGPVAGGVSPVYSRIKKLTNLAVLNQNGLAQLAEFGPMIGAVGWKRFTEIAGSEVIGMLRKTDSPLTAELKHMNILVPEEKLFRDDLTHEFEKTVGNASELTQKVDNMLNKGQRIQGYTSGYYAIRNIQQRIAVTSAADRIMREMKSGFKGEIMSIDRLADAGMDRGMLHSIYEYVKKGDVQFDKDGNLVKMNMHKWNPRDAEDFSLSLNRVTHQLVQKAMAGESSVLFHKDGVGSLFFHLKSFPMQALEKQAMRNYRMMDNEGAAVFMYGLATAGAAYTVKQTINNRTENLTAAKIANGAFGMSNMTGWIPMWVDPVAGMLGMNSLRFNQYGDGHQVLGGSASIDVMNRMLQLPGAAQHYLRGVQTTADVRAIQTLPMIGNAYGFTAIFNAMKSAAKENSQQMRRDKRAEQKQEEQQKGTPIIGKPLLAKEIGLLTE